MYASRFAPELEDPPERAFRISDASKSVFECKNFETENQENKPPAGLGTRPSTGPTGGAPEVSSPAKTGSGTRGVVFRLYYQSGGTTTKRENNRGGCVDGAAIKRSRVHLTTTWCHYPVIGRKINTRLRKEIRYLKLVETGFFEAVEFYIPCVYTTIIAGNSQQSSTVHDITGRKACMSSNHWHQAPGVPSIV
ncbi:uncharacterized protein BJ212DRAFT_1297114 [Suillus subaureus]|uniref:Uncharacterized protein n=1 Tax=Suillus subaureus TaxID=48587 RepID=A0A9P7JGY9_9AGAM|nr:uncharacterized protein BJ212DRAFT_1297114 [Suillus subaureus]KAG1821800.1 hypothetical protein BJ212DRAFT_1297114 [Suillus subaureus]